MAYPVLPFPPFFSPGSDLPVSLIRALEYTGKTEAMLKGGQVYKLSHIVYSVSWIEKPAEVLGSIASPDDIISEGVYNNNIKRWIKGNLRENDEWGEVKGVWLVWKPTKHQKRIKRKPISKRRGSTPTSLRGIR